MLDTTTFHLLSFEGPDPYARAGGVASRVSGLADSLAAFGFETHLWFVGDPDLPGHEQRGHLHLHRWCQWISRYHPGGVYAGEEDKRSDYAASLPPVLVERWLTPQLAAAQSRAVVLAEEWQTVDAVLHLDWRLQGAGLRERVRMFWNANNVFGFDRIDWPRLRDAATITTVSRYMRQCMWERGVDALVVPNGLPPSAFTAPDRTAVNELRQRTRGRVVLAKAARWDPDKRWLLAVETAAALKNAGRRPLLIARGGVEAHGAEVLERAAQLGLRVVHRRPPHGNVGDLVDATADLGEVDVLNLQTPLAPEACRTLFRAASAVLVNSGHEPFGLVGLESMAVGGLTCVGGTGEDYAASGWNALVLQTSDPSEFIRHHRRLESNPAEERALRRRATTAARQYAWPEVVRRHLLPHIGVETSSLPLLPVRTRRVRNRTHAAAGAAGGHLPLAARQTERPGI